MQNTSNEPKGHGGLHPIYGQWAGRRSDGSRSELETRADLEDGGDDGVGEEGDEGEGGDEDEARDERGEGLDLPR